MRPCSKDFSCPGHKCDPVVKISLVRACISTMFKHFLYAFLLFPSTLKEIRVGNQVAWWTKTASNYACQIHFGTLWYHFRAILAPKSDAEGLPGGSGSARKKGAKIAGTRAGRKCGSQAPIIPSKVTLSSEPWREVSPKEIRVGKRVAWRTNPSTASTKFGQAISSFIVVVSRMTINVTPCDIKLGSNPAEDLCTQVGKLEVGSGSPVTCFSCSRIQSLYDFSFFFFCVRLFVDPFYARLGVGGTIPLGGMVQEQPFPQEEWFV